GRRGVREHVAAAADLEERKSATARARWPAHDRLRPKLKGASDARTSTPVWTRTRGAAAARGPFDPSEGGPADGRPAQSRHARPRPLRPPLRRLPAAHRLMPTWDFDTPGKVRLDLEIPFGRVEIETATGETTHVSLEGNDSTTRELVEDARVEMQRRGAVRAVLVGVRHRGFMISIGRSPTIRLRVVCPPGADAVVRTKSADITGRGTYGSFEAKTASGDIEVDEIGGDLRVKTASGDVAAQE